MEELLEKVASELDKMAEYVEEKENSDLQAKKEAEETEKVKKAEQADIEKKEKEEKEKVAQEAEKKKRAEVLNPIREKLSQVVDEEELKKLDNASIETLEVIKKGFETEKVADSWGDIEEEKTPKGRGKSAGYKDPIEAFAMGE
jgi:hypothetical protein